MPQGGTGVLLDCQAALPGLIAVIAGSHGHKAALEGRWKTCMNFFAGPKLLVIDELGYLPLPEDGASALFQVINQRYLKSSTILTTNVGIADWAGSFGDATVAAAMLDRGDVHRTVTDHRARRPDGRRARAVSPTNATGAVRCRSHPAAHRAADPV
ncbi:ATP-binding protein [Streptomyces griseicoloratus]|uniref:ATP-binding protein n=1 Tax=Streptomyces griseicoloratus TaxID=2752516 RepID=UPI0028127D8E|nr:ATP-binding protein [Streptomyces griseicoloratus]